MKNFIYKFLPIFFGCHCRPDRSFFYKGQQFPICARCTGELVGIILGIFVYFFNIPNIIVFLLGVPLIIDGFIQLLTSYESNNIRRLWTGILFGMAFTLFIIKSHVYVFQLGLEFWN